MDGMSTPRCEKLPRDFPSFSPADTATRQRSNCRSIRREWPFCANRTTSTRSSMRFTRWSWSPNRWRSERVSETVLIVDDQAEVADGIAAALMRAGRQVIVCYDAESAQLVVETTPVFAVISDVRLTGPFRFEGLDFLDHLERHAPEARVALVSGMVTPELEVESLRRGAIAVLQKPFEIADIENILASGNGSGDATLVRIPTLDEIIGGGVVRTRFQPIVRLATEEVMGFESLAGITIESFLARPDLLFLYAERKGRVTDLELTCMASALRSGAALREQGRLFMNLHPAVLGAGERVREALTTAAARWVIPLGCIVLELPEQAALGEDEGV